MIRVPSFYYMKVIITSLSRHTKPENRDILLLIWIACKRVEKRFIWKHNNIRV